MGELFPRMAGEESVFVWSLLLTIGVPALVVGLSEIIERLRKSDSPYEPAFRALRNVFLPALTFVLIATQILQWGSGTSGEEATVLNEPWEATARRIIETVFWFAFAYTMLVFVGALTARSKMQTTKGAPTWEARMPAITRTVARVVAVILPFAILGSTVWNLDLTRFLTAIGVGSIAVAFALQNTLSSVISGILLALDKPFKEGDWIEVDGHTGQVIEINWRTTQLMVEGRDVVIIPNTTLLDSTLKNYTRIDPGYRDSISFGFAYRNMPNLVKDVALQAARECPLVSDSPAAEVHLTEYGDSSVNYDLHFHVARYNSPFQAKRIREELMTRLFYAAARHDLEIPFPIRTVRETHTGDMTDSERLEIGRKALTGSPATSMGDDKVLTRLAAAATLEDYGRGMPLSEVGAHEDGIAQILEGRVAVQLASGQDILTLGPGQWLGTRQVVGRRPNRYRTVALSDVVLVRFPDEALNVALGEDARLARGLHAYSDAALTDFDQRAERLTPTQS